MSTDLLPFHSLLVKPKDPKTQFGSIIAPSGKGDRSMEGEVLKLPLEATVQTGVQVGDRVVFAPYAGHMFEVDGESLMFLSPDEIMATVSSDAPAISA